MSQKSCNYKELYNFVIPKKFTTNQLWMIHKHIFILLFVHVSFKKFSGQNIVRRKTKDRGKERMVETYVSQGSIIYSEVKIQRRSFQTGIY